jgi:indole-3-glycerol phosphate synthase
MGFLTDLVDDLRHRLERDPLDESSLMGRAMQVPPPRPFEEALRGASPPAVIAEFKRSSPSAGEIAEPDLSTQVRKYRAGGSTAR